MPLENHYSGDKAFKKFASIPDPQLDEEFSSWEHKDELIRLCHGDNMIARVVFFHLRTHSIEYMNSHIPALDGLSPIECMRTKKGQKRLKECLLRSH